MTSKEESSSKKGRVCNHKCLSDRSVEFSRLTYLISSNVVKRRGYLMSVCELVPFKSFAAVGKLPYHNPVIMPSLDSSRYILNMCIHFYILRNLPELSEPFSAIST